MYVGGGRREGEVRDVQLPADLAPAVIERDKRRSNAIGIASPDWRGSHFLRHMGRKRPATMVGARDQGELNCRAHGMRCIFAACRNNGRKGQRDLGKHPDEIRTGLHGWISFWLAERPGEARGATLPRGEVGV